MIARRGNPNWVTGVSGNPRGRNRKKSISEVTTEQDKKKCLEVIRYYLDQRDRQVAMWFADQCFGKAITPMEIAHTGTIKFEEIKWERLGITVMERIAQGEDPETVLTESQRN